MRHFSSSKEVEQGGEMKIHEEKNQTNFLVVNNHEKRLWKFIENMYVCL